MSEMFRIAGKQPLLEATFLARPNRFLVECLHGDQKVQAFLPNPGRLWEVLLPDTLIYLHKDPHVNPSRKTEFTVIGAMTEHGPVMLHTHKTNDVAAWLFDGGLVPGLENFRVVKREVSRGNSRFDLLVSDGTDQMLIEVKSCTLFGRKIAMFPDAPSLRAVKHLQELCEINRKEMAAGILFIVQSGDPEFFIPDFHIDYEFATKLYHSQIETSDSKKLAVKALKVAWSSDFSFSGEVREIPTPWNVVAQEAGENTIDLYINTFAEEGFYHIFVSSSSEPSKIRTLQRSYAKGGASSRTITIRTQQNIEGMVKKQLSMLCDRVETARDQTVFIFKDNPLKRRSFVQFLIHTRIDRLAPMIPSNLFVRQ